MRISIWLLIVMTLCGCTTATIKSSGDSCEATYSSFWKESAEIGISACGADGMASGSGTNTDATTAAILTLLGRQPGK